MKFLKTVPKISIKIWRPILDAFDKKIEAGTAPPAHLNR